MNGGINGQWNNPFMYLIWLAMFGNGIGFGNNAVNGMVTRAELADGLNNQTVLNDLRTISNGLSNIGSSIQSNSNGISQQLCSGINNLNTSMLNNSNGIVNAINTAAANQQVTNCNIAHSIQDNKYEIAQNTCAITNAVHQEGELTRKTIYDQQMQDLRDAKESTERQLQSAQFTLANANQTQNILGSIGRFVPYAGYGSVCGCNNF